MTLEHLIRVRNKMKKLKHNLTIHLTSYSLRLTMPGDCGRYTPRERKIYSMRLFQIILALPFFFIGCATNPVILNEETPQVPLERVYQKDLLSPMNLRQTKVTISRDNGYLGSGVYHLFKIDGQDVAKFRPGEALTIFLEDGDYLFGAINSPNPMSYALEEIDVTIKADRRNNFRLMINSDWVTKIQRSSY